MVLSNLKNKKSVRDSFPKKTCNKCKSFKCYQEFYNDKNKRDGKEVICIECKRKYRNRIKNKIRQIYNNINKRCYGNYGENSFYKNKNIQNFLTIDDLNNLWKRDKCFLMKKPSIDRIDNSKSYYYENCQFIEHSVNSGKNKLKKVIQNNLEGKEIKKFDSIKEAFLCTGISFVSIGRVCNGIRKTAGGYHWRFDHA